MAWTEEQRARQAERSREQWEQLTPDERAARGWSEERRRRTSERMRAHWAALTPEQREARVEAIRESARRPRREEHRRKLSEAQKRLWESGGPTFKPRSCRNCGSEFAPASGSQVYCTYDCSRDHRPARHYRLSGEEYRAMFDRQAGVCALCGMDNYGWRREKDRPLVVDHCHDTGKVRGLLCGDCNTALGRFGDDPERLRRGADYLEGNLPE